MPLATIPKRTRWGQDGDEPGAVNVTGEAHLAAINDASYSRLKAARKEAATKMAAAVAPSLTEERDPTADEVASYNEAKASLDDVTASLDRIVAVHDAATAVASMDEQWAPILNASRNAGEPARSDAEGILDVARKNKGSHSLNLTSAAAARIAWQQGARGPDWLPAVIEAKAAMAAEPLEARRQADSLMLLASSNPAALIAALDKDTSRAGEEFVPTIMASNLFERLLAYQGIMSANPQVIVTDHGLDFTYPIWDQDQSATVADDGVAGGDIEPRTSSVTFKAWNFVGTFNVEENWLQDVSGVIGGIDTMLETACLRAVGKKLDLDLTTGNGTATAQGVVTGATAGVSGLNAAPGTTPWTPANIMSLIFAIDDIFDDEGLRLICRRATRQFFLGARASATAEVYPFLMSAAGQAENRQTVLGVPLHSGPNVVAVGANVKPAVLANLQAGYGVRLVGGAIDGGGLTVDLTDSHASNFTAGVRTIRCKLRADGRYLYTAAGKFLDTA